MRQTGSSETHKQMLAMEGIKRALRRCNSGHLVEFIAVSACFVWEDTRVRLRLLWFSQVRLTVSRWPDPVPPRGMLKVWSSAGRFFREAQLRLVRVRGRLIMLKNLPIML